MRLAGMCPEPLSQEATAEARAALNVELYCGVPEESVYPSTSIGSPAKRVMSSRDTCESAACAWEESVDEFRPNRTAAGTVKVTPAAVAFGVTS
jgi:hypothetical protein